MASSPPTLVAINHDDRHAEYIGVTTGNRQFFLTTPFVPAVPGAVGEEFVALYLFSNDGSLLEARIKSFGPRRAVDHEAVVAHVQSLLGELEPFTFTRIEVKPFQLERFGTTFGLVLRAPEEEDDSWWVEVEPGNYMAFHEPWDEGEYDT